MTENRRHSGSALILAVVLTTLLALIGMMFVMVSRVDSIATSGLIQNRALDSSIDTIIAIISDELAKDVPSTDPENPQEYYDYPDPCNAWLASLEPYRVIDKPGIDDDQYFWSQISDVTGFLLDNGYYVDDVNVKPVGLSTTKYVLQYSEIETDAYGDFINAEGVSADADGDGIADSKWIKLDNVTSGGKPIYAAIRIIDNSAMLNVNTAYYFDPDATDVGMVDGSSQMQINLSAIAKGADSIAEIGEARNPDGLPDYQREVIWKLEDPDPKYGPFDISDELVLRNRFIINQKGTVTRLKNIWKNTIDQGVENPYDGKLYRQLSDWKDYVAYDFNEINFKYCRRHLMTTYNIDRIIDPSGSKMVGINTADANSLYDAVRAGLIEGQVVGPNNIAAQIAVNLIDSRDDDEEVTVFEPTGVGTFYGYERPCTYISELAHIFKKDPCDPNIIYRSYAVELYKPYFIDDDPNVWQLSIDGTPIDIAWSGSRRFHLFLVEDSNVPLTGEIDFNDIAEPNYTDANEKYGYDPNDYLPVPYDANCIFGDGSTLQLWRFVPDVNGYIAVDTFIVPPTDWLSSGWLVADGNSHSIQRDIYPHKCIRNLWGNGWQTTLGGFNDYNDPDPNVIQAHPYIDSNGFTNVGQIGMVFREDGYNVPSGSVEAELRLKLTDPNYQPIFRYLTVFDPSDDGIDNDGDNKVDSADIDTPEYKVPGRININTAPWYVIAQLPWVSQRVGGYDDPNLAKAIVAYRDKIDLDNIDGPDYKNNSREFVTGITGVREEPGFAGIGELTTVVGGTNADFNMDYYALDTDDLEGMPDLTQGGLGDGAVDDFEERDVIFSRISNLVTVRSDVFTAYILVRVGTNGPQKRVVAILDRSDVYPDVGAGVRGNVKVRAVHPVAEPK